MRRSPWMLLVLLLALLTACGGPEPAAPAATSAPPAAAATNAPAPTTAPAPTAAAAATAMLEPTAAPAEPTTAPTAPPAAQNAELTVFAAASLTDAFKAIGQQFGAANGGATVTFNF